MKPEVSDKIEVFSRVKFTKRNVDKVYLDEII